jgi:hypothetical protein
VVVTVLLVVVGPDRPRPTALLPPRSYAKPEAAAAAVNRLLMMGKGCPKHVELYLNDKPYICN